MRERAFVLAPLADLAPQRRLPPDGRTVGELLSRLPEAASTHRVRRDPRTAGSRS
jgi:7,8-dihydro-6-hydroxymethylpterin-pyrophosphokinase